jgi:hypothetical protein
MNKDKAIKTFCTVLDDFLNDLYMSYPDPGLFILRQTTKTMSAANPILVVSNFMDTVGPYKEKILNKDETFFINGGLTNELSNTEYSFLVEEINKITDIWNRIDTPQKTKESIWKYFKVLITLGNTITKT